jgi:hypothetical protein
MDNLKLITKIKESYGAKCFALDEKDGSHRLVISLPKKLTMFLYTNSDYQKYEEQFMPDYAAQSNL